MKWKGLAIFAVLLAVPQLAVPAGGQGSGHTGANLPVAATPSSSAAPKSAAAPATRTDCEGGTCDYQPSHITIATPAPAPAAWPLQDRIAWGANLVLVLLGYAAILMGLSTLRKIERQTRYGEAAATAAAESAQTALLHAQAMIRAERPWILVTVEPARGIENGFVVTATNRGRSPARIAGTVDETRIAVDEKHLPPAPAFRQTEPGVPLVPIILLPGESTGIRSFSREDVKGLCEPEQKLQRVETWDEKIYLYGKLIYSDLTAPDPSQTHETGWCCWYIHGKQKSGMVMAGPPEYNQHT